MANSKLPHERMREWADTSEKSSIYPSFCMCNDMVPDDDCPDKATERNAFRRLADEVEDVIESAYVEGTYDYFDMIVAEQGWPKRKDGEIVEDYVRRCFLPRPRFEDGETVQFGDPFLRWDGKNGNDGENVTEITVKSGDYYRFGLNGDCCTSQRVKRPAPKVLDADGVPIEVGDTVWLIRSPNGIKVHIGERLTVEDVTYGCVKVRTGSGSVILPHNKQLTHREPDSLRKLRNDIAAYRSDMAEPGSILDDALDGWTDRLTSLMERGAE